jgi:hypothetical protein
MDPRARASWLRPLFTRPGRRALHLFVAYGSFQEPLSLPIRQRDCARPEGLNAAVVHRGDGLFDSWLADEAMSKMLREHDAGIEGPVRDAKSAVAICREVEDRNDLEDLRCSLASITSALGWGAVAIADPLCARWWSRGQWVNTYVEKQTFEPLDHVSILVSNDWVHTRGMRKFGRYDVSIRGIAAPDRALGVLHQFIDHQARGGLLDPARRLDVVEQPNLRIRFHDDERELDAPDFNNVWVELDGLE